MCSLQIGAMSKREIQRELLAKWLRLEPIPPTISGIDTMEHQLNITNNGPSHVIVFGDIFKQRPYEVSPSHAIIEPQSGVAFKFTTTNNVFSGKKATAKEEFKLAVMIVTEERMIELELKANDSATHSVKIEKEHLHLIKYTGTQCNFIAQDTGVSSLFEGALRLIDNIQIKKKYKRLPSQ